jgi:hypothetical protein
MKKEVKHLLDLQGCIDYLRVRLDAAGDAEAKVILKNKMFAELSLIKQRDALCKAGYVDSTNSLKNLLTEKI